MQPEKDHVALHLKQWLLLLIISFGIAFALYGNTIFGEPVHDDIAVFAQQDLRHVSSLYQIWGRQYQPLNQNIGAWRPVTTLTFALNFIVFGESPVSFHIGNILLHGIMITLLFLFVLRIFERWDLAIFTTLLFAFLPIHTGAVAYIKSRDELLYGVLSLAAWLYFLRAVNRQGRVVKPFAMLISCALLFFASLSKEPGVTSAFVMLVVYAFHMRPTLPTFLRTCLWYVLPVFLALALRLFVVGSHIYVSGDLTPERNPLILASLPEIFTTAFAILWSYIFKVFVPLQLSATYAYNHFPIVDELFHSPMAMGGAGLLMAMVVVLIYRPTRHSVPAIGAMMFLTSYLLISRFIFPANGGEMIQEHWMYLRSVGLCLIVASGITFLYKRNRMVTTVLFSCLLVAYTAVIIPRNRIWLDQRIFYEQMAADAPGSFLGHLNVAILDFNEKNYQKADGHLAKAAAIAPWNANILLMQGKIAMLRNDWEEAERIFKRVIYVRPQLPEGHELHAFVLTHLGRYEESLSVIVPFFVDYPDDPQLRFLMAANYWRLGNEQEARKYFDWNPGLSDEEKILRIERL